ncbi:MAG: eukaryotic-like serine/threonine-protein kinase, partial [Micromonosporaceae bacterium]|nr:eukaryotic-like serine/threonine-protein kinase [Micromonosporaceae bacterium]
MTVSQVLVAGRYRLVRSLGRGGMGQVWLARDEVLHRDVAVKEVVLPAGLTDTELEELRQRTLREARAAARLSHPNVVQIYDVVRIDDQPWIVMEYV